MPTGCGSSSSACTCMDGNGLVAISCSGP
jgi:hypothetical protein